MTTESRPVQRVWYLSGPMSGYENYNYPMFERCKKDLERMGYKMESPHECEPEPEGTPEDKLWDNMMIKCMDKMKACNGIILLRGWPESRGARRELDYAIQQGWPVLFYNDIIGMVSQMSRYKNE